MNIIKIVSMATLFASWLEEAQEDGEISAQEILELLIEAVTAVGLDLRIKL